MPYPEFMVAPMREDLVKVGFSELRTPEEVDDVLGRETRTVLVPQPLFRWPLGVSLAAG